VPLSFYTSYPIEKEQECIQLDLIDFIVALGITQIPVKFGRLGLRKLSTREALLRVKAQYVWPPLNIISFVTKQVRLMRRSTVLISMIHPGKPYWRGTLSTFDLLLLTRFNQLLFTFKILFSFVTKHVRLMRRSSVLILPLQLVFPDFNSHATVALYTSVSKLE
jgi:hypothetical protein